MDPKDTFVLPFSTNRSMVNATTDALIPYSKVFKHIGKFIQGKLYSVDSVQKSITITTTNLNTTETLS